MPHPKTSAEEFLASQHDVRMSDQEHLASGTSGVSSFPQSPAACGFLRIAFISWHLRPRVQHLLERLPESPNIYSTTSPGSPREPHVTKYGFRVWGSEVPAKAACLKRLRRNINGTPHESVDLSPYKLCYPQARTADRSDV